VALPYLKAKLKPVPAVDSKRLTQLIADLDSDVFANREKATKELQNLGEAAEPALNNAFANPPSLEVKRRVREVLDRLTGLQTSPERLQKLRAIEALEHMGTPEARVLLQALANGALEARSTREAVAALQRLKNQ
jgi:hypothetical protein